MKLHEYQAKQVLERFGVPVPKGALVQRASQIPSALKKAGRGPWVLKAQVHAGGRGKAGGIQQAKTSKEAQALAKKMLGMNLVSPQTGPDGKIVRKIWVEPAVSIQREIYLGIALDRKMEAPVLLASREGGVEIEELAKKNPGAILRKNFSASGMSDFEAREAAFSLGFSESHALSIAKIISALAKCFLAVDASLVEINPLVITMKGEFLALDAKISLEDSGLFRHQELAALRDPDEENPHEIRAERVGISYIKLSGNIGCMVNGAGLAMATMDIIKLHGGAPANFLDVGGGANQDQVCEAFKILLSDKNVKAVLVNIFGGIMKCDVVAEGILAALASVNLKVPLVVRLEGNRVKEGKALLTKSNLKIIAASDLTDAAKKVVSAANG